jgi:hypothetical protein
VIDHPAGRLAGIIPALERGDQGRRGEPGWSGELADAVELDLPTPSSDLPARSGISAGQPAFRGLARSLIVQITCSTMITM